MSYDSRPDTYEHIGQVRGLLLQVVRELLDRAHVHDASKLADPERAMFDEFTPKLRETTYGSPEYERCRAAMGEALTHHYAHNRHHPEYHPSGILGMSLIDLLETVCDWIAATRRHADGDIRSSIVLNRERFGYDEQLEHILLNTVEALEGLTGAPEAQAAPRGPA